MGDRCSISVTLRKADLARFGAVTEWEDCWSTEEENGDAVTVDIDEVNYGGDDALDAAAADGIRFYGNHGPGCSYGPEHFLSDGKVRLAIPVSEDGWASVRYDPETGKPDNESGDKQKIKRFVIKLRHVKQFVHGKEPACPN